MDMHDLYVEIFGVCLYHGCSWSQATDAARAAVAFFDQDYGVGVANDAGGDGDVTEHDTVPAPAEAEKMCGTCKHVRQSTLKEPCNSCEYHSLSNWEPASAAEDSGKVKLPMLPHTYNYYEGCKDHKCETCRHNKASWKEDPCFLCSDGNTDECSWEPA